LLTVRPESSLSDDEEDANESSDDEEEPRRKFAFPELDAKIREVVKQYGAVFPKLNFSSPRVSTQSTRTSVLSSSLT
jgi:hypothetical protein